MKITSAEHDFICICSMSRKFLQRKLKVSAAETYNFCSRNFFLSLQTHRAVEDGMVRCGVWVDVVVAVALKLEVAKRWQ